jgi:GAF domain-containing protein/HAMP domain-containing protein
MNKRLPIPTPKDLDPKARNAFLIVTVIAVVHFVAAVYYLLAAGASGIAQFYTLAFISFVLGMLFVPAAFLSWRGQSTLGIIMVLSILAVTYPPLATLVSGLGLVLGLALMIVGPMTAFQTLPRKSSHIMSFVTLASSIGTGLLDVFGSPARPHLPGILIQVLAGLVVIVIGYFMFRQSRHIFRKVPYKLISTVVIILVVIAGFQILYSNSATKQNLERESEDVLISYYKAYQTKVSTESMAAETLALSIAERADVQELYLSGDREGLYNLLSPLFAQWKDRRIVHLYIENPDGTVFLRVHTPEKFGDDITYRGTANTALKEKRVTSGIEIGPNRLGVRGVAPMFTSNGQFIGLAEVGVDFDEQFLADLKAGIGGDFTMWVSYEAAAVPNLKPADGVPAAPLKELFHYASTNPEILPINPDIYRSVLETGKPAFQVVTRNTSVPTTVYIMPLLGYNDKVLGLLQISEPYTEHIEAQNSALLTVIGVTTGLTLLGLLFIWLFSTRVIIRPLNLLSQFATRQMAGETSARVSVNSEDEFQQLAETFNAMASSVEQERINLESRVAERTSSLVLAAEVGRSVSQVRELHFMLKDATEIIRSQFDLYYAQVYLTDPAQKALILEAGTGTVGAELVSRGHHLPLNTGSINGRAVVEKRSIVISDTSASMTFRPNPLLPNTKSEMAVPLPVGEKVVGVLDLQSEKPGALNQDMLPAFEALAGQLAIAIQNANLLAETEQARAEMEAQARRMVRKNWEDYLDAIHTPEQIGFVFEGSQVFPLSDPTNIQPVVEGNSIQAPIAITGESLGNLIVETDAQDLTPQNTELVNIIARQVAQQIENLRLLESAERYRSEAEQAARRLTHEGWQEYMKFRSASSMGYLYDLNEVRPANNGHEIDESAVALPLKVREQTIGKLSINGLTSDDKDSMELINAVVERLGTHIDSLRQYEQTQSALAQSEKLFDASSRLTQATDLQELVASVVKVLDIPEVNRGLLTSFDYDSEGEIKQLNVIGNWWSGEGTEITPVGTRYSLEVIQAMPMFVSSIPVFFNDTSTDERIDATTMKLVQRLNLRAVAVLPLHLGSRQIGALILEAEKPHTFTTDETRLFASLAPQIATVLENRQQYEKAQHQAKREAMLNVINQKIQGATTVDAVLQIAARELGNALGAPLTIAQLGLKNRSIGN